MVDIFVVHSGKDYDYVKGFVEPFLKNEIDVNGKEIKGSSNANVLTLESGEESNWKKDALKKIRCAQVVIILIGADANDPKKDDTMGWEVEKAIKFNKQLFILNKDNYDIPKYLYGINRFTLQKEPVAKTYKIDEIKQRIDDFANGIYKVFSDKYEAMSLEEKNQHKNELLDQYKMFQKSSEDLVSRRQSVSSFYITVNSALIAIVGILIGLVSFPSNIIIILFMSLTGIILDVSWIRILEAYGTLNSAKMKVIKLLEKQLPAILYEAEWQVMCDKLNNKKYVSFTNSEKRIPIIFSCVYGLIIIASIVFLVIKYFA